MLRRWRSMMLIACLAAAGSALADQPPPGCETFSWNVSAELALFAKPGAQGAAAVAAAAQTDAAPAVQVGQLYAVSLVDQAGVRFAHAPGKTRLADGAHGGLLSVRVPATGKYRITLDQGSWIDVVNGGMLVDSNQFQGRNTCPLFHKSVEYTLPADATLIIQLSGETASTVRLAVTAVP